MPMKKYKSDQPEPLCFELPSEKSVVGPNGPKSKTKLLWKWLQALDSREINGAPGEIQTSDPLLS